MRGRTAQPHKGGSQFAGVEPTHQCRCGLPLFHETDARVISQAELVRITAEAAVVDDVRVMPRLLDAFGEDARHVLVLVAASSGGRAVVLALLGAVPGAAFGSTIISIRRSDWYRWEPITLPGSQQHEATAIVRRELGQFER